MMLYGKNSILERLKANPQTISKVLLQDSFNSPQIEELIKARHIPVERVSARELARVKHAKDLQGIVARVEEFEYTPFSNLLDLDGDKQLTLIFLDRLNDPQNLGVIIRTAACFGRFGLVIPRFNACAVTEAVLHVASGGENYVPVSMAANLSKAMIAAKQRGYWIAGCVISEEAQSIYQVSLPFPLAFVLGSEGGGIRYGLQKQFDLKTYIPMEGAKLSFNVAIACAIFCHEVSKRREASK